LQKEVAVVSVMVFVTGLMLIGVSYLWLLFLGRIADPSWRLGRDDAKLLGTVTGIYVVIAAVVWSFGW